MPRADAGEECRPTHQEQSQGIKKLGSRVGVQREWVAGRKKYDANKIGRSNREPAGVVFLPPLPKLKTRSHLVSVAFLKKLYMSSVVGDVFILVNEAELDRSKLS